jgi:transcriptional regulator with XRE-family HTH domain
MYSRFAQLLQESRQTPAEVSRLTEIHPSTFSDWKKDKSSPKYDKLQRISRHFQVPVEFLMGISAIHKCPGCGLEYDMDNAARLPSGGGRHFPFDC